MKVLIACDKFKGSLTAPEACTAIRAGLLSVSDGRNLEIIELPVADGGDGLAGSLTESQDGQWITIPVQNALGESVEAGFGLIQDGTTAVIEMAEASGLALLGDNGLHPARANTFGTGQLIQAAIQRGVSKIILGIGGSATNDAGTGMALALGWRFFGADDEEITDLPLRLNEVRSIEPPTDLELPEIIVACDVKNPLLGPKGCTRVYGPQKGIQENEIETHESRLTHLVELLDAHSQASQPGAGAAGGLGFGSMLFLDAKLTPGFELVSSILNLEEAIADADLIITGEGRLDRQSLEGKAPFGVAGLAHRHGKKLVTFCGLLGDDDLEEIFGEIVEIRNPSLPVDENMAKGEPHLKAAAAHLGQRLGN